jgi:hypothetical protein
MKNILIIGNRYTSHMDIIATPHYRLNRIAEEFRKNKFNVIMVFIDYKTKEYAIANENKIKKISLPLTLNIMSMKLALNKIIEENKIDTIFFSNGPIVGGVLFLINKRKKLNIIYDVIDNYDTYYPQYLFFIKWLDKKIRNNVDFCAYITKQLLDVDVSRKIKSKKILFPNGVDINLFKPKNKKKCKLKFGLNKDIKIIGFSGSVDDRVYDNLVEISNRLAKHKNIKMVISGFSNRPLPKSILYVGFKNSDEVVDIINSFDVAIIPSRLDEFTKYCFPSKLMEYVACNVDFIATKLPPLIGVVPTRFLGSTNMLKFTNQIIKKLKKNNKVNNHNLAIKYSWKRLVKNLIKETSEI